MTVTKIVAHRRHDDRAPRRRAGAGRRRAAGTPSDVAALALFSASGLAMIATLWGVRRMAIRDVFRGGDPRSAAHISPPGSSSARPAFVVLYLLANVAYIGCWAEQVSRGPTGRCGRRRRRVRPVAAAAIAIVAEIAVLSAFETGDPDGAAGVLRNGARWGVLPAAGGSPSAVGTRRSRS